MINEKRYFEGGINADDEPRLLAPDEYLNMENMRIGAHQSGKNLRIENIPSTILLYNTLQAGTNLTIGTAKDYARKRIFFFNWNSTGEHGIYAYDLNLSTSYIVLLSSQTAAGLNFSKSYRINRNAKVYNDLLIWTDNLNEPRCINIEAGIKLNHAGYTTTVAAYATPIPYTAITLIKKPPVYPLYTGRDTDIAFGNNFIQEGAYQFCYRYRYKFYQTSALSAFSNLEYASFPDAALDENRIMVTFQLAEIITDEVQAIDLCVRYGNTGKTFIIKTWDKDTAADAAAIAAHNAGTSLNFNFYDDITGIALDDITANTPFDDVGLLWQTVELARNRLFGAGVLKGYNTPAESSLTASFITANVLLKTIFKTGGSYKLSVAFYDRYRRKSGIVKKDVSVTIPDRTFSQTSYAHLILWALSNTNAVNEIPDWAYYYQIHITRNLSKSFFIQGIFQNASYVKKDADGLLDFTPTVFSDSDTYTLAVNLSPLVTLGMGYAFNEGDFAIVYKDPSTNFKAKVIGQEGNYVLLQPVDIGALTNSFIFNMQPAAGLGQQPNEPALVVDQVYTQPGFSVKSSVVGTFNITPDNWIFYFYDGVARTFNVSGTINFTARANSGAPFKLQLYTIRADNSSSFVDLDVITSLVAGVNYTFTVNTPITVATNARKLYVVFFSADGAFTYDPIDGGLVFGPDGSENLIEIYTPYKATQTEPYYETGLVYNITNPTLSNRIYSQLSGSISGDAYFRSRLLNNSLAYKTETMNPNDNVWQQWDRNIGWANFVDTIGQQLKKTSIQFSDVYISGTKNNGFNRFQPLNSTDIGSEAGAIQKLQLTNKQQEDGTVMLILCDNLPLSMYLGEQQLSSSTGDAVVSISKEVIGSINSLKNSFGTVNPESVVEYMGNVFWLDAINGVVAQYGVNGVIPISDNKMKGFFDRYCKKYISQGTAAIETLSGFAYISGCIDPVTKEYLPVLPQVENAAFQVNLPSYGGAIPAYATSIKNRFDIYDGRTKTLSYNFERNKWQGSYDFIPDCMEYFGDKLFGFKSGVLYLHNENNTSFNTFYGVQYPQRLCFTLQGNHLSLIKDVFGIALESNGKKPNYTVLYADYPNEQITDLIADNYTDKEGVQYAMVLRDRLSPNITGSAELKMLLGEWIKSATPFIMIEFTEYTSQLIINFINIEFEISKGHKQILQLKT